MTRVLSHWVGNEYNIHAGDYSAVITEQGAALQRFEWQGQAITVPTNPQSPVSACSGQILIPYPNRIEDGTYEFEGTTYRFPIDEHERHNSIHGLGYRYPWKLSALTQNSVSLTWRTPNLPCYPFDLLVTTTYHLSESRGLTISVEAYNNGRKNAPWALATHPWFANGLQAETTEEIDAHNAQCRLMIPGRTHVQVNDRLLPVGSEAVDNTRFDLREGQCIGDQSFDDAWTDLIRDADDSVSAIFTRPDGIEITISGDETITSFQVCNGYGWNVAKKPQGVAIEPQTAYANAFRTGKDVLVIAPEHSAFTNITYSARRINA